MPGVDILVRGAGAVGLTGALLLAHQGFEVAVLDPAPAPPGTPRGPDVRAYALNPASVALLQRLKVWDALPPGARTAVHDMRVEGDARGSALEFSAWTQGVAELAWIVDAAELDTALNAALRFAARAVRVEREVPAALQVLAEGRDSAARQALGVRMPLRRYGQRGVAARLVATQPHGGRARQWFRSPDVLALLPMDRPEAGHGLGLVWSTSDAEADRLLALDDAAFEQALFEATGGAAGALRLAGPRASWPLALARAERWCGPGWVLVGDAAHLVHPLAGQGLNLGLGDVAALARVLAAREPWRALGDARLLQRYARERLAPVRAMGAVTDGLLQLFAHPSPAVRELRNRGLNLVDAMAPLKRALAARALGG